MSADIGAGHNAAGRALEEAMARAWPGCQVCWLDALAAEALSLAVMTGGIVALAHRAPQVARNGTRAGRADPDRKKHRNTIC